MLSKKKNLNKPIKFKETDKIKSLNSSVSVKKIDEKVKELFFDQIKEDD